VTGVEIVRVDDVGDHSKWLSSVVSKVPPFETVYSNDALTVHLFREAGYAVRELPLHKRTEYAGTEVRRRMRDGEEWHSLVPDSVATVLEEIDAVARLRKIGSEGSHHQEGDQHRK
jgi:nicotinamide-nucleotide adenylyltransferase